MKYAIIICSLLLSVLLLAEDDPKSAIVTLDLDGEIVKLIVYGSTVTLARGSDLIAEISVRENAHSVKSYSENRTSIHAQYRKGKFNPKSKLQFVEKDSLIYLNVYDDTGRVEEEVLHDDGSNLETDRTQ